MTKKAQERFPFPNLDRLLGDINETLAENDLPLCVRR